MADSRAEYQLVRCHSNQDDISRTADPRCCVDNSTHRQTKLTQATQTQIYQEMARVCLFYSVYMHCFEVECCVCVIVVRLFLDY